MSGKLAKQLEERVADGMSTTLVVNTKDGQVLTDHPDDIHIMINGCYGNEMLETRDEFGHTMSTIKSW